MMFEDRSYRLSFDSWDILSEKKRKNFWSHNPPFTFWKRKWKKKILTIAWSFHQHYVGLLRYPPFGHSYRRGSLLVRLHWMKKRRLENSCWDLSKGNSLFGPYLTAKSVGKRNYKVRIWRPSLVSYNPLLVSFVSNQSSSLPLKKCSWAQNDHPL